MFKWESSRQELLIFSPKLVCAFLAARRTGEAGLPAVCLSVVGCGQVQCSVVSTQWVGWEGYCDPPGPT